MIPQAGACRQPHWCSPIESTKCFVVFGSDLRNLHRGGELWGEYKILLVEFFNSLEKIDQSLEFNGVPRSTRLKTVARSTARSTGHAQKCTKGEKACNGQLPGGLPRRSSVAEGQSIDRLVDRPMYWFWLCTTSDRPPGRQARAQT